MCNSVLDENRNAVAVPELRYIQHRPILYSWSVWDATVKNSTIPLTTGRLVTADNRALRKPSTKLKNSCSRYVALRLL
jgi:hypothetical protein